VCQFRHPPVARYVNLIGRQLFSAETGSRQTVRKLRFWHCWLFIISWTVLPYDVLSLQFKYCHNRSALWTADYILSLDPQITPYNDDNEDQNVQPGDVLNHGYKDDLSLDYSMYDGHSTDYIPNCGDVNPSMKDMYAVRLICMPRTF
jgi:hypothetical protein